jgi:hypothetical protein
MNRFATLGFAALISLGFAAQASAFSFSPKNKSFSASGKTNLTKGSLSVPCTSTFVGSSDAAGVGHIKSATFSGGLFCSGIKAVGLPWTAKATTATKAVVYRVSVSASVFGTCGPTNVPVSVSKTGVFTFANVILTPNCKVNGTIASKPPVTIVSP